MHDHAIGIDDEQATQGNTLSVIKNVVGRRDLFLQVRDQGIVDVAKTTLVTSRLNPGQMAELTVHRNA